MAFESSVALFATYSKKTPIAEADQEENLVDSIATTDHQDLLGGRGRSVVNRTHNTMLFGEHVRQVVGFTAELLRLTG